VKPRCFVGGHEAEGEAVEESGTSDSDSECEYIDVTEENDAAPTTTGRRRNMRVVVDTSDSETSPGPLSPVPSLAPVKHLSFNDEGESDRIGEDNVRFDEPSAPAEESNLLACPSHVDELEAFGLQCTLCRCNLDAAAILKYNELLDEAHRLHKQARASRDRVKMGVALGLLLDAVQICSDDVRLHSTIIRTAKLV
jgi:hypothetical protein